MKAPTSAPAPLLRPADVAFMVAGIVIGAGIFRAPADVARLSGDTAAFLALWALGGLIALMGAFTYVALARRAGGIGGEYLFLDLGWGRKLAALFVWARIAVMQTGALATVAFVAGDYLAGLLPGGSGWWAAFALLVVTAFNLAGLRISALAQRVVVGLVVAALLALVAAGLSLAGTPAPPAEPANAARNLGLALVFVMLVYGGWNEAAYLSGETRGGASGLRRGLVGGILLVAILYLAVNLAYLAGLGRDGLAAATAPAALVAGQVAGPAGVAAIAAVVALASFSTLNVTTITGARAMCALGRDLPPLAFLGQWDSGRSVPVVALLVQGAIALALVAVGSLTRDGFEAMVAFSAPVFWGFLALVALVPFRVPGMSAVRLPAALFAAACLWMLWSALGYARFVGSADPLSGWLGLGGLLLVVAGVPLALRTPKPGAA